MLLALFPLDRCGWFRRDIVANAVYATYLINNLVAYLGHEVVRQMCPVGCHCIGTGYSTQGYGMLVGTLIAHHTYTANSRKQDGTCLPDLIVERNLDLAILHISRDTSSQHLAGLFATQLNLVIAQAADIDIVGILQDTYLLRSDIAQDTNSQARTREG